MGPRGIGFPLEVRYGSLEPSLTAKQWESSGAARLMATTRVNLQTTESRFPDLQQGDQTPEEPWGTASNPDRHDSDRVWGGVECKMDINEAVLGQAPSKAGCV